MKRTFRQETLINAPAAFAFAWHDQPGAFERLAPPWEDLRVLERTGGLRDGGSLRFEFRMGPIWRTWHARHYGYAEGKQFCDEQVSGPFASWKHVHRFEELGPEACRLTDEVEYELPMGMLGAMAPKFLVEDKIAGMFAYRGAVTKRDIERHYGAKLAPARVLVSGASGLVGGALSGFLATGGHEVVPLKRFSRGRSTRGVVWDPHRGFKAEEGAKLEGLDAVVHLAGETILGLWTREKKERIRESRVVGTRLLCEALAGLEKKPRVLVCASASGIYAPCDGSEQDESAPLGDGFLAGVAREWEEATAPASDAGIRVVLLRIGVVLSPKGGALKVMGLPFSLGLGGRLGTGDHYMSWITLDDLVGLIHHAIAKTDLVGAVNAGSPKAVTNRELTRTLARVLHRPVGPPVPGFVIRRALGEMAEEVFLRSVRMMPRRALESGFEFGHPDLEGALRHLLGRPLGKAV